MEPELQVSLDATSPNEPLVTPPAEPVPGTPEIEPVPEPVVEPPAVIPEEDEITRLQRIIATDPNLRQTYAQQYYPPQQSPQQQFQQQPQAPPHGESSAPQLPFKPEEYNPYDLNHQAALTSLVVQQAIAPALQFIQQYQQQDQVQQQTYQQQQAQAQMQERQKILEKTVPGFSAWTQPGATPEQISVASFADREYLRLLSSVDPNLQSDIRVQQHILTQIAPKVKALATKFGVSAPASTAPPPVYVEGTQRVPTVTTNAFDKAFKADDSLGMVKALGKLKAY